jgi:hypothetical protein
MIFIVDGTGPKDDLEYRRQDHQQPRKCADDSE